MVVLSLLHEVTGRITFPTTSDAFDESSSNTAMVAQCYNIPYGAFGFISILLHFYTMYCFASGRKWWAPWETPDDTNEGFFDKCWDCCMLAPNLVILCVHVLVIFALSIHTIYECRGAYRHLAVARLLLSCLDDANELFAVIYRKSRATSVGKKLFIAFQCGLLLIPGVAAGITGIRELVEQNWSSITTLHIVTWVFVGVFAGIVAVAILWSLSAEEIPQVLAVLLLVTYGLGSAYADWVIGIVVGNIEGMPPKETLGAVYFAAKHLDLLLYF